MEKKNLGKILQKTVMCYTSTSSLKSCVYTCKAL